MRMAVLLVAGDAQVEVVADRAVVAGLHRLDARVAVVDKLILALVMRSMDLLIKCHLNCKDHI